MNNNQEPIVLGTVKKGKTGRPLLAIILIIFIGALIYFLPVIQGFFKGESIIDLIKNGQLIEYIQNGGQIVKKEEKSELKEPTLVKIEANAIIENSEITISNISLNNNVLTYTIASKKATYDASKDNLYLQIYSGNNVVFTQILDEIYTLSGKEVKENVVVNGSNFSAALNIINDNDIPNLVLNSDESGLASITCTLDDDKFEYTFINNKLSKIKREYSYQYNSALPEEYREIYEEYSALKSERSNLGIEANIEESYSGLVYKEEIDLQKVNADLGINYYSLNTEAKVVKFKQEAKGFDCE